MPFMYFKRFNNYYTGIELKTGTILFGKISKPNEEDDLELMWSWAFRHGHSERDFDVSFLIISEGYRNKLRLYLECFIKNPKDWSKETNAKKAGIDLVTMIPEPINIVRMDNFGVNHLIRDSLSKFRQEKSFKDNKELERMLEV